MADQPDIFAASQEQVKAPDQAPQTEYADLLKSIVNENGQQKYDSLPKALEGLTHAQQYIPQLKTELQLKEQELVTLRNELAQRASVEDVVTRLTAQKQDLEGQGKPPESSGLNEQAVLQLVQQALGQAKATDQAKQNHAQVQQALSSKFGDKAAEVVASKARELGTTTDQLGQLASQNPAMVLALFNTSAQPIVKPTTGSVNLPSYQQERPPLERPAKSVLSGATSKQQKDYMLKVRDEVYARHGITQ
jgi:hypothetical protein